MDDDDICLNIFKSNRKCISVQMQENNDKVFRLQIKYRKKRSENQ